MLKYLAIQVVNFNLIKFRKETIMTKYYIGSLEQIGLNKIKIGIVYYVKQEKRYYASQTFKVRTSAYSNFFFGKMFAMYEGNSSNDLSSDELQIINKFLNKNKKNTYSVIYEIVTDQNGCIYGKELLSGLLFPINEYANYLSKSSFEIGYSYGENYSRDCYLNQTTECHHANYEHIKFVITDHKVATQNDLDNYRERYTKSFNHKHKLKKHLKLLSNSYKSNVFSNTPVIDEFTLPLEPTPESLLMDNIEYLLLKLSNYNQELSNKYMVEYQNLLTDNSSLKVMPANTTSLKLLEHKIKLALSGDKGNALNIIDYLNNLCKTYLESFLTNNSSSTKITLEELDKLYENYLIISSDFSLPAQRNISRNFTLLYLLEIKENISTINITDLSNSYVSKNLKSFLITIDALNSLNLIEPISIDLFHQLTIENIINMISQIQFKKITTEQTTELIKQLTITN